MEELSKLYYDGNFAFDKIVFETSDSMYLNLGEKVNTFNYAGISLGVIEYNYCENSKTLKIGYINSMNDTLVGIIERLKKQNICNNSFIENKYKKYLSIYKKTKGLGTYMVKKLIEEYNPNTLIIDIPLMESRKFWFKIVRKLYKEGKFTKIKFIREPLRKDLKNNLFKIKGNLQINHAFSKIILEK